MQRTVLLTAISTAALIISTSANAQQDAAPQAGQAAPIDQNQAAGSAAETDIIVTGSRISRRDYTSASPIVTTNQEALKATGQPNLEAALKQLPQFAGGAGSNTSGLSGVGFATVNLRGLGDNRNLVLLDGRRLPLATASGVTDINILPQSLIGGVEVISGGASAVYGSDAVSGVVNFKARDFTGIEMDAQYKIAEAGDASLFNGSLTAGSSFAGGRGHIFATGSYTDREAVYGRDRSFFKGNGSGSGPSGSVQFSGSTPSQAAVDAVFAQYGIAPGTVSRTSRFGFNDDGTLYSVTGGSNLRNTTGRYGVLRGQVVYYNNRDSTVVVPQERYNAFVKTSYEITPAIELYAQGLYSHSEQTSVSAYPIAAPINPVIPLTNPFIPADLRTLITSRAGSGQILLFKAFQETTPRAYVSTYKTYQALAGARGTLTGDWKWDVYASYDKTRLNEKISNVVLISRVQRLLNAADGGNSICAGGYNPFGEAGSANISASCRDYISESTNSATRLSQTVVEASANGSIFELPAGPVKLALTAGYRSNKININPDILLIPNYDYTGTAYADLVGTQYGQIAASATTPISPASGKVSVKEIAGELLIPLLQDLPFAQSANLTVGARYSDYNTAGGVTTYKAELDWRPISMLLLRGGYERAIRAPNVGELFSQQGTTSQLGTTPNGGDPCDTRASTRTGANGAQVLALCQAQFQAAGLTAAQASTILATYTYPNAVTGSTITGSTALSPEKANTFTAGAVVTLPSSSGFVRRASFSADYYNIEIKDAISTVSGALALSKCFNRDGSNPTYDANNTFCSSVIRAPGTGLLFDVLAPYRNIGAIKTSGIDFQFESEFNIINDVWLGLNSVVSRLFNYKMQSLPGAAIQDFAGTVAVAGSNPPSLPKWRALTTLTIGYDQASLALRWRFVDSMRDVTAVTSTAPAVGVPSYNIFDLFGRLPVAEKFELRAGVNNLFDKKPLSVGGVEGQTETSLYDYVGRSYFVGAKVKF